MRYICPICGYIYDEAAEGVPFDSLPDSWSCPLCGAPKLMFEPEAAPEPDPLMEELEALKTELDEKESKYLRLAAEYDNFRKRSQKEKESIYADAKSDAVLAFLPVYDNLDRALKQETADEAYKKGVEMTMAELEKIFQGLGAESFGAPGDAFDPNLHNAVAHIEDENLGENVIAAVYQKGYKLGDRVVRHAMVQVAN